MKIFFDTNVYISEALRGMMAARLVAATRHAKWRIYFSNYLVDEIARVLVEQLGFSPRTAAVIGRRIARRSTLVRIRSVATVPDDPKDSPILQAALSCGAEYLVTNDRHLLTLDPFEGLRIIPMHEYLQVLKNHGLLY